VSGGARPVESVEGEGGGVRSPGKGKKGGSEKVIGGTQDNLDRGEGGGRRTPENPPGSFREASYCDNMQKGRGKERETALKRRGIAEKRSGSPSYREKSAGRKNGSDFRKKWSITSLGGGGEGWRFPRRFLEKSRCKPSRV